MTTVEEARAATQDYLKMKPEFVKIWVDDRGGKTKKLTPPLYLAIIEEAHKANVPVAAHNVTLADAKLLMKAGVEGWLHLPVRMGEVPDDELIAMVKDRIARNDRPKMWFNPGAGWTASSRADWDDPLLRDTDFAAADTGAVGRLPREAYARVRRPRAPESKENGRNKCAQTEIGGHEDRAWQRRRPKPVLYRLDGTA